MFTKKRLAFAVFAGGLSMLLIAFVQAQPDQPKGGKKTDDPAPPPVAAEDETDPLEEIQEGIVPDEMRDLTFDRYADLEHLAAGYRGLDAFLLTDVALQFAEGERVLQRPHKSGISSDKIFKLALRVAGETQDKNAFARLETIIGKRDAKELTSLVGAMKATMSKARSINPASKLSVEAVSPETFANISMIYEDVQRLKSAGDATGLTVLAEQIAESSELGAEGRAYLEKVLKESRTTVGDETDPMAETLRKLTATARGNESNRNDVRARVEGGGWNVVWGINVNEAEYAKLLAAIAASVAAKNPAPIKAYFEDYLDRTIVKMKKALPNVAMSALNQTIAKALKDRGRSFSIGRVGIRAGIATYNRWYMTSVRVPDGTERYKIYGPRNPFTGDRTWTWGYRAKYKTIQKKIPLANHHQPYIAFRLY